VNNEFVDLRSEHLNNESFWPSFTDIMMVIVIIFLLTSMLLMVKNWELLDQLRNSMAAEEQAEEIIHHTSQENATLGEQLTYAQNEISMLRMQMMQASMQTNQLNSELEDKQKKILLISSEKDELKEAMISNENKIINLTSQVSTMKEDLTQLQTDASSKQKKLENEQDKLIIITQERDEHLRKLSSLETDFGSLRTKYEKLIRPARTFKDKYIVSVDYERINGKERIRIKGADDDNYTLVNKKQLHKKLAAFKKKHPESLYVRIIIPEKSGLTYNEAWNFMRGLLNKYDYYYQDK